MNKKSILNRPMFRQVKSPAYGTGISANLVSSEERQKYNYGGRVGLRKGTREWVTKEGNLIPKPYLDQWAGEYTGSLDYPKIGEITYDDSIYESQGDLPSVSDLNKYEYYSPLGQDKPYVIGKVSPPEMGPGTGGPFPERGGKEIIARGDPDSEKGDVWFRGDSKITGDPVEVQEYPTDESLMAADATLTGKKNKLFSDTIVEGDEYVNPNEETLQAGKGINFGDMPQPIDEKSDTLDIEGIVDKYYDKKASLGAAQLGLAGQVLKAGFQPRKDAMGTVGDAMGQFGKNISEDKKAFKKLAATGEIQRELYRMSRSEEGKQDRATLKYKNELTEWLKKNGAEEDEISDIMKYNSSLKNWGDVKDLTGQQHQNLVGGFDEEFASNSIVMDMQVTGTGKDRRIGFSQSDLDAFAQIDEGSPIFIGNKVYIKDSSVQGSATQPQGMREVNYTQLKLLKNKPKKKPFKRFQ